MQPARVKRLLLEHAGEHLGLNREDASAAVTEQRRVENLLAMLPYALEPFLPVLFGVSLWHGVRSGLTTKVSHGATKRTETMELTETQLDKLRIENARVERRWLDRLVELSRFAAGEIAPLDAARLHG